MLILSFIGRSKSQASQEDRYGSGHTLLIGKEGQTDRRDDDANTVEKDLQEKVISKPRDRGAYFKSKRRGWIMLNAIKTQENQ